MKKIFAVKVISWMVMNMTTDEAIEILRTSEKDRCTPIIPSYEHDAIEMAIEALKREQWIPCDEFLPLTSGTYQVTLHQWSEDKEQLPEDSITVVRMRYLIGKGWMVPTHSPEWINKLMHEDVLAWKYMPEPYKENKK